MVVPKKARVAATLPRGIPCPIDPRFADELDIPMADEVPLRILYER
ncbi:MAG: hypothetical protein ACTSU5_16005 [Promethearchaeota archaeon]